MNPDPVGRKFVPVRMFGGLALVAAGAGGASSMFVTDLFDGVISTKLLLFFGILVLGGAGLAWSAFALACTRCNEELKTVHFYAPPEWRSHIQQVVASAQSSALTSLGTAPPVMPDAPASACLTIEHCPKCFQVARLKAVAVDRAPGSDAKTTNLGAAVTFAGAEVGQLVQFAHGRPGAVAG